MTNYIVSNPHIMSGVPVIKGTRIPISRIIFLFKEGYTLEEIHQDYPHVPLSTLNNVLDEIMKRFDSGTYGACTPQI